MVRILPVFQQHADHSANCIELAADHANRLLPRAEIRRIAAMLAGIAIARPRTGLCPFGNKIVPRNLGGTPPPPLLGGGPLARQAQSRRAERVGEEVGGGGTCGHFGRIYPKLEHSKNYL
jgi:hypothetical protein